MSETNYRVSFDNGSGQPSHRGVATGEVADIEKYYNPEGFAGLIIEEITIQAISKGYKEAREELEEALHENSEDRKEIKQEIRDLI